MDSLPLPKECLDLHRGVIIRTQKAYDDGESSLSSVDRFFLGPEGSCRWWGANLGGLAISIEYCEESMKVKEKELERAYANGQGTAVAQLESLLTRLSQTMALARERCGGVMESYVMIAEKILDGRANIDAPLFRQREWLDEFDLLNKERRAKLSDLPRYSFERCLD